MTQIKLICVEEFNSWLNGKVSCSNSRIEDNGIVFVRFYSKLNHIFSVYRIELIRRLVFFNLTPVCFLPFETKKNMHMFYAYNIIYISKHD